MISDLPAEAAILAMVADISAEPLNLSDACIGELHAAVDERIESLIELSATLGAVVALRHADAV
jgi:hypothetical protein